MFSRIKNALKRRKLRKILATEMNLFGNYYDPTMTIKRAKKAAGYARKTIAKHMVSKMTDDQVSARLEKAKKGVRKGISRIKPVE